MEKLPELETRVLEKLNNRFDATNSDQMEFRSGFEVERIEYEFRFSSRLDINLGGGKRLIAIVSEENANSQTDIEVAAFCLKIEF